MTKFSLLEFHEGIDYAVIMTPDQTTDNPLASLYGDDREVRKYGHLFVAAPALVTALKEARKAILYLSATKFPRPPAPRTDVQAMVDQAIAAAEGGHRS